MTKACELSIVNHNHRVELSWLAYSNFQTKIYICNKVKAIYRIDGKFGGELNLVVWQSTYATAKLKSTNISYLYNIIIYGNPLPSHQI